MVVSSIRQVGSLKPQVKVRELRVGQAEIPPSSEQWSLQVSLPYITPSYKRSDSLTSRCDVSWWVLVVETPAQSAPLATLLEAEPPNLKHPRTPYIGCSQATFRHLSPPIFGFFALSLTFLKIFSPNHPGAVRRALNRRPAPTPRSKTPEFRGKTAHSRLAAAPKSTVKHRPDAPKNPPLTQSHEKKLSKVRSSLLTALPRGCILEYMRLKEAAQTTPHGAARAAPTASKTFKLSRLALEEAGH